MLNMNSDLSFGGPEILIFIITTIIIVSIPYIVLLVAAYFFITYWLEYRRIPPGKRKKLVDESTSFARLILMLALISFFWIAKTQLQLTNTQLIVAIVCLPLIVVIWYLTSYLPFRHSKKLRITIVFKRLLITAALVSSLVAWFIVLN